MGEFYAVETPMVEVCCARTASTQSSRRVSRGLTAAANYHSHQMGMFGFFEHESHNGAPFWKRIERFYPAHR
ncbi:MAG TPA: hypothetical protein VE736_04285, partial [Gaiellaceae bacterium]|nr:hypothetical protein [Gaiellaceae bacterium]